MYYNISSLMLLLFSTAFGILGINAFFESRRKSRQFDEAIALLNRIPTNMYTMLDEEDLRCVLTTWIAMVSPDKQLDVINFRAAIYNNLSYPGFYKNPDGVKKFLEETFK